MEGLGQLQQRYNHESVTATEKDLGQEKQQDPLKWTFRMYLDRHMLTGVFIYIYEFCAIVYASTRPYINEVFDEGLQVSVNVLFNPCQG